MPLVLFLFAFWLVLGTLLLRRFELPSRPFWVCFGVLVLAMALRLLSMDHVTMDYTTFLSTWVQFFRDNGGFAGIKHSVGDYNVPYLYFLAAMSYLPVYDLYLIKLLSVFFDLLLAFTALRLARRLWPGSDIRAAAAFSAALLLPTVILNGAYWGQCDVIYGALVLLALAETFDKRPGWGLVWLGVAFSFKLQTIFLIPLWCVFWYSGRVRFKDLLLFPASYGATILPALLLGKPLGDILGVYFNQMGQYNDRLTLNAPSLYALIPYGAEVDGAKLSRLGILAAFGLVLLLLGGLFFFRKGLTEKQLLTAAVILAVGVPLFLPHMHDRYFFLADVLSVLWALEHPRRIPVPLAVQTASIGGYHAYLRLKYLFPMAWGAWMLVGCLLVLMAALVWSLRPERAAEKPNNKKKNASRR